MWTNQLSHWIKPTVMLTFFDIRKNNVDDYIVQQSSGLEKSKLDTITGKNLFKDSKFMVREKLLFLLLFLNNMISSPLNNKFRFMPGSVIAKIHSILFPCCYIYCRCILYMDSQNLMWLKHLKEWSGSIKADFPRHHASYSRLTFICAW